MGERRFYGGRRRKNGHRQRFTALHITSIALNGTAVVTAGAVTGPVMSAGSPFGMRTLPMEYIDGACGLGVAATLLTITFDPST